MSGIGIFSLGKQLQDEDLKQLVQLANSKDLPSWKLLHDNILHLDLTTYVNEASEVQGVLWKFLTIGQFRLAELKKTLAKPGKTNDQEERKVREKAERERLVRECDDLAQYLRELEEGLVKSRPSGNRYLPYDIT